MKRTSISKYLTNPSDLFDKIKSEKMIFFDTETTGLDANHYQVTEIAAIAVEGDDMTVRGTFQKKIKLSDKTNKQLEYEKEHPPKWGIQKNLDNSRYEGLAIDPQEEVEALEEFKEFCGKHNSVLFGHNAKFDMAMVGTKVGKIPNNGVYDTMLFARFYLIPTLAVLAKHGNKKAEGVYKALLNTKGKPSSSLGSVGKALGIDMSGWHGAMADVKSTIQVYRGIIDFFRENQVDEEAQGEVVKERDKAYLQEMKWKGQAAKEHKLTGFFKRVIRQEGMAEFRYEKKSGEIRPVRMKPTRFSKAYDGVLVVGLDADRNNEERNYYLKDIDVGTLKMAKERQMNKKQVASELIKIAKQLVGGADLLTWANEFSQRHPEFRIKKIEKYGKNEVKMEHSYDGRWSVFELKLEEEGFKVKKLGGMEVIVSK